MTALTALIRKDLILYLTDRRALLIHLLMPVALAAFMGYLFDGSGKREQGQVAVALVAQDTGAVGRRIADALKADPSLKVSETSLAQAREQVRQGKLSAAIVIPAGFGDAAGQAFFGASGKPEIALYYDPSQSITLAMLKGMLTHHVMQTVSAEMFSGQSGRDVTDLALADLERTGGAEQAQLRTFLSSLKTYQASALAAGQGGAQGMSTPFATREEALSSGPKYNGYAHSFAGMSVQFILFFAIDVGIGVLLARRAGIWSRLQAAPVSLGTLLLARALSCALIAFGLLCAIFAVAMLVFQVRIAGSVAGFLGVAASFALMSAAFGLLIAAFGRTPEAARGIATVATLVMVMLGGAWVPSFVFPAWMQTLTLAMPTRWAVNGLDAMIWRGLDTDTALASMGAQLGFALLFGLLAWWKFHRDAR